MWQCTLTFYLPKPPQTANPTPKGNIKNYGSAEVWPNAQHTNRSQPIDVLTGWLLHTVCAELTKPGQYKHSLSYFKICWVGRGLETADEDHSVEIFFNIYGCMFACSPLAHKNKMIKSQRLNQTCCAELSLSCLAVCLCWLLVLPHSRGDLLSPWSHLQMYQRWVKQWYTDFCQWNIYIYIY